MLKNEQKTLYYCTDGGYVVFMAKCCLNFMSFTFSLAEIKTNSVSERSRKSKDFSKTVTKIEKKSTTYVGNFVKIMHSQFETNPFKTVGGDRF